MFLASPHHLDVSTQERVEIMLLYFISWWKSFQTLGKILEWLDEDRTLLHNQFGFKNYNSTVQRLTRIKDHYLIQQKRNRQYHHHLDIESALE